MIASPPGDSGAALPGVPGTDGACRASLGGRPRPGTSDHGGSEAACTARSAASPPPRSLPRIAVVVRKRPLSDAEKKRNEADLVQTRGRNAVLVDEPREKVDLTPYVMRHEFRVDYAFDEHSTNAEVYRAVVRPLVETCCLADASTSCFAYGQTGSGKTYTMLGPQPYGRGVEAGVFELAAEDIFKCLEGTEKDAFVSFFEIYNGKLFDLLQNRKLVAALENGKKEVVVRDLRVEQVRDKEVLLSKMIEGIELRKIGANSVNDESSRSHAILQVLLRKRHSGDPCGRIAFIDLAGSERGADTLQHSRQTQQDGAGINRSLLALKECIRAMDQDKGHIPFRDSELTKVLREIFVGRSSRSVMIATVSPSTSCCEQTLNTLRYASRVKNFRQVPPSATAVVPASVASLPPRPSSSTDCAASGLACSRSISSASASRSARASLPCMQPSTDSLGGFPDVRSPVDAEMHAVETERWGGGSVSPTPHLETAALSPLASCSPSRASLRSERVVAGRSARSKVEAKGAVRAGSLSGSRRDARASLPGRVRGAQLRPEVPTSSSETKQSREEDESAGSGDAREETEPQLRAAPRLAPGPQRDRSSFSGSTCAPSSCDRLSSCGSAQTSAPVRAASVRGGRAATLHPSPQRPGERSTGLDDEATAASRPSEDRRRGPPTRAVSGLAASRDAGAAARAQVAGISEELRNSQDLDLEDGETETLTASLPSRPSSTRKPVAGSRVVAGDKASLLPRTHAARASSSASPFASRGGNGARASLLGSAHSATLSPDSTSTTVPAATVDAEAVFGAGAAGKTTRGRGGEAFEISLGTRATRKPGDSRSTLRADETTSELTPRGDLEALSATRLYKSTRLFGAKLARGRGKGAPSLQGREAQSVDRENADSSAGEKDSVVGRKEKGVTPTPLSRLRKTWLRAQQEQQAQHGALVCPDGSSIIFVPRHGRTRDASPFSPVSSTGREGGSAALQAGSGGLDKKKSAGLAFSLSSSSPEEDAEMEEGLLKKRRDEGEFDSRDRDSATQRSTTRLSAVSPFLTFAERDVRPASAAVPGRGVAFPSKLPRPSASPAGLSLSGDGCGVRVEKPKSAVVALDAASQRLLAHLLPRAGIRSASLASPRRRRGDAAEPSDGEGGADETQAALAKRKKGEAQGEPGDADLSKARSREERMHLGREPQTILQETFACTADYHNLDLAELDRLQGAVADRRAACMQRLLQLAKKRAEEASSRHGINESQQDILVCRLHQANPGSSEFGEYMRQRMEADFRKLLAMRQLWVEAEELRMLHRLLTTEHQTKSGAARARSPHRSPASPGASPSSRTRAALDEGDVSSTYWKKADVEQTGDVEMTEAFPSPPLLSGCAPVGESDVLKNLLSQQRSPRASRSLDADACAFVDC
ncbi:hypothetical protein NCLIV_013810 [Neospora caninum Liverpool]|uniref:Kinesin-related protein 6 n=1 Tax=Neospora caninum (strain Liverpool) TaxID=572307 RepID=F0VD72_NEOCL|nr:hypothetical protein NCLIV_013810 [Neospora caninum Liverpool]CBZ51587.1 hypothetical protein NCLIV_013810 [Neospora caninum Liverpool]CEL65539.1 TPA: Kinesin-related protein 6 [Neospora caninum Liverpool]|eukprot:XP_003881620.1 hypothetical protein NCLIV_013810 [Neospora caninum Liverpool]